MKKLLLLLLLPLGFGVSAQSLYWDTVATGFSAESTGIGQFSYAGTNVIWGYGTDGTGGQEQLRVWTKSVDGGVTWTSGIINVGSDFLAIGSISAVSATTAYVSVFPDGAAQGGIWRTVDGGVTWTKQPSASYNTGTDSFANIVHMWPDGLTGWSQGDPAGGCFEMYTTVDGGANWTRVPCGAAIPAHQLEEYGYTHNFAVEGNTIWFGTNKGRMYKSLDKGLTWTVSQTPITDFGGASVSGNYDFENQTNGILISSNFDYFRTTDGGANWVGDFPEGNFRNYNIAYVPGTTNTYVSTGEDFDGARGSSFSNDGGATWFDINSVDIDDPINNGSALAFADETHGVAGGFTASSTSAGAFRWKGTFLANVDFQSGKAFTAYPNPTNGVLEVAGKNIVNVAVYDILGKQVVNNNYTSLNSVNLNLGSLNAGVYMVKVTNDAGATSTIKVVKQ